MSYKTAKELYDAIKSCEDNKQLYAICNNILDTLKKHKPKKNNGSLNLDIDLEDKSLTRTHVLQHLFQQSSDGNATASNYLAKLAGLTEETASLTIELVRFTDLEPVAETNRQGVLSEGGIGGGVES